MMYGVTSNMNVRLLPFSNCLVCFALIRYSTPMSAPPLQLPTFVFFLLSSYPNLSLILNSPSFSQVSTLNPITASIMYTQLILVIISLTFSISSASPSHLLLPTARKLGGDDTLFCESWRFTVETNDCQPWSTVPTRCLDFVKSYMTGDRYVSDSNSVANNALLFAKSINVSHDGFDAWVFDIDETLLSGLPYYALHGFGSEVFNEETFYEWCSLADAPAVPASLKLYKEIQQLGFTIFILTGRDESVRNSTEAGLLNAGFSNWKRLILRQPSDKGIPPTIFKSGKRQELVDEGYRIRGNSGDQWSDLLGFAIAQRSFKLPNLLYYLP